MHMPSATQWIIILLIIVLLFGARKIPELARGLGKGIKSFKDEMNNDEKKLDIEEKKNDKNDDLNFFDNKKS